MVRASRTQKKSVTSTSRSKITRAAGHTLEQLESRRLLSVASPSDDLNRAIWGHTLTPQQIDEMGLMSLDWKGQQIYAKANEWIVGLERAKPTFAPDGELIDLNIKFAGPNTPSDALESKLDELGLGIKFGGYAGTEDVFLIKAPAELSFEALQAGLAKLDKFSYVEPNGLLTAAATTPNDPKFSSQYGLNNTGQTGGTTDADIDAPEAWDKSTGWSGVVVGVIDSGVDYNHADLAANIWSNPNEIAGNGIDDDGNGYADDTRGWDFRNNDNNPMDDNGHGTHVAGTIAAVGNNGVGVTGVAWNAKMLPLKFIGANGLGNIADAVKAIQYATDLRTRGVNIPVTNNSWGGDQTDQSVYDAIQASANAGMLFVAAAGNGGNDQIGDNTNPVRYKNCISSRNN